MATSSTLSPGTSVEILITTTEGAFKLLATVRMRMPDAVYFDVNTIPPLPSSPSPAQARWQSRPLLWSQNLTIEPYPNQSHVLVGHLQGSPKPVELRKSRRYAVRWPASVRWGIMPGSRCKGMAVDVSTDGARLVLPRAIPEDAALSVTLNPQPQKAWHCPARLLRQTQTDGTNEWQVVVFWAAGGDTEDWKQWISHYTG